MQLCSLDWHNLQQACHILIMFLFPLMSTHKPFMQQSHQFMISFHLLFDLLNRMFLLPFLIQMSSVHVKWDSALSFTFTHELWTRTNQIVFNCLILQCVRPVSAVQTEMIRHPVRKTSASFITLGSFRVSRCVTKPGTAECLTYSHVTFIQSGRTKGYIYRHLFSDWADHISEH